MCRDDGSRLAYEATLVSIPRTSIDVSLADARYAYLTYSSDDGARLYNR